MPSTTFDQLGDVRNVCTEHSITIATTDWSSTAPYTYEWTSTLIAENSDVEVEPRDGAEAAQIEDFDYEKSTGKVTFTVDKIPAADLPLTVKIINAKPGAFQSLNASDVSSEAIIGANNVEAALDELNGNINTETINTNVSGLTLYKVANICIMHFSNVIWSDLSGYTVPQAYRGNSGMNTVYIRNNSWANIRLGYVAVSNQGTISGGYASSYGGTGADYVSTDKIVGELIWTL